MDGQLGRDAALLSSILLSIVSVMAGDSAVTSARSLSEPSVQEGKASGRTVKKLPAGFKLSP